MKNGLAAFIRSRRKWVLEPRYRLFYISQSGNEIRLTKFPQKVLSLSLHRPYGKDIYHSSRSTTLTLSKGDVIKIRFERYKTTPNMSIFEYESAIKTQYFRYQPTGYFEAIPKTGVYFVQIYPL